MLSTIILGATVTIVCRSQNETVIDEIDGSKMEFEKPYFQYCLMEIGQLLCILVYCIKRKTGNVKATDVKVKKKLGLMAFIVTVIDVLATCLLVTGLPMCTG